MNARAIDKEPVEVFRLKDGACVMQNWPLPVKQDFLAEFLTYVFVTYWDQIVFGPRIEGAAYELTCSCQPTNIKTADGYLTISFGGSRLHLCISESQGSPTDPTSYELQQRRKPLRAGLFRHLDQNDAPIDWGFEMTNGWGESLLTIFFANPFLSADNHINSQPQWEKLAMWRDLAQRYLGREPEDIDKSGNGFREDH